MPSPSVPSPPTPLRVLIAGGGVAALEAALALQDLAGERVAVTLLAPDPEFVYRPMTVREPFAYARAGRYDLPEIADDIGVELVREGFAWVDPAGRTAHTTAGTAIAYDALVLAMGARPYERFPHALTIDDAHLDDQLHGLIQDVEGGDIHSLAFVLGERIAWPLPMYEIALMTAARAYDTGAQVALTIVTPEDAPLAIFGPEAAAGTAELLSAAGIDVITSADAKVPVAGQVIVEPGGRTLDVDRVIALPGLMGPSIRGVPGGRFGFIRVDPHGRVPGVEGIYAAGDATDFPVKLGSVAAQQADAVAQSIAALAGAPIEPKPFRPEIHGLLLTGGTPRYLSAQIIGGEGFNSQIAEAPDWSPTEKIAALYLEPYLEQWAMTRTG